MPLGLAHTRNPLRLLSKNSPIAKIYVVVVVVSYQPRSARPKLLTGCIDAHEVEGINLGCLKNSCGVPYANLNTHFPSPKISERRAVSPCLKTEAPIADAIFHIRAIV